MNDQRNRKKFTKLIEQSGFTQAAVAELLAKETKRPCSLRTLQSWLSDKESARPCPDWPIEVLGEWLTAQKKKS